MSNLIANLRSNLNMNMELVYLGISNAGMMVECIVDSVMRL